MTIFENNLDMVQPSLIAPRRRANYANVPDTVDLTGLDRSNLLQEPFPEFGYDGTVHSVTFQFNRNVRLDFPPILMIAPKVVMWIRASSFTDANEYAMITDPSMQLYIYSNDTDTTNESNIFMDMNENHKYVFADVKLPSWLIYEYKAMAKKPREYR